MQSAATERKLTFPTIAEQVVAEFHSATKTTSIATLAKKRGADVEKSFDAGTTYRFDDDTSITLKGTGANHKIETHLP